MRGPRFTVRQGDALEVIGSALKRRKIDFFTATKLADQVKAGREVKVVRALTEIADSKNRLNDLLEYTPDT